jgi:hypothetical protein
MLENPVAEFPFISWGNEAASTAEDFDLLLESGKVLYFPKLRFEIKDSEKRFLNPIWSDGKAKNISLRGASGAVLGASGTEEEITALTEMVARFSQQAESLVEGLFPNYRGHLHKGFTSYRPAHVETRVTSWRKDDTRLHVDSFPSNPTGGLRLLRVFTNINPEGAARVWRIGEPFEAHAKRFLPQSKPLWPGQAWLLKKLGLTKSKRSPYDQLMGQLHDLGKHDVDYQKNSPQMTLEIPPGATWVVFSDQVLHAVMSGQYMLEQTFYIQPEHLKDPSRGPLSILERLTGKQLLT